MANYWHEHFLPELRQLVHQWLDPASLDDLSLVSRQDEEETRLTGRGRLALLRFPAAVVDFYRIKTVMDTLRMLYPGHRVFTTPSPRVLKQVIFQCRRECIATTVDVPVHPTPDAAYQIVYGWMAPHPHDTTLLTARLMAIRGDVTWYGYMEAMALDDQRTYYPGARSTELAGLIGHAAVLDSLPLAEKLLKLSQAVFGLLDDKGFQEDILERILSHNAVRILDHCHREYPAMCRSIPLPSYDVDLPAWLEPSYQPTETLRWAIAQLEKEDTTPEYFADDVHMSVRAAIEHGNWKALDILFDHWPLATTHSTWWVCVAHRGSYAADESRVLRVLNHWRQGGRVPVAAAVAPSNQELVSYIDYDALAELRRATVNSGPLSLGALLDWLVEADPAWQDLKDRLDAIDLEY